MSKPISDLKFSICVPTRNRADTLYHCLKSLLHQDLDNYEIIVSDNSDSVESDETKKAVDQLDSNRIRYVRPDRVLSMTENFEFTLENATGDYILFMGDDDGLVVNSLGYVADLYREYQPEIIKCPGVIFYWPGSTLRDTASLCYPCARPHLWLNGKESLTQVFSFDINYYILPMIYYSFVKRELIEKVMKVSGTFFSDSISPDIYSGIVLSHYVESYMISSRPFTIAGLSSKSNGINSLSGKKNKITEEFKKQQNAVEKFKKYQLPYTVESGFDDTVLFELFLFMDRHSIDSERYKVDFQKFLMNKVEEGQILNRPDSLKFPVDYKNFMPFREPIEKLEKEISGKQVFRPRFGYFSNLLINHIEMEPDLFQVKTVYDAACLCEEIAKNHTSYHHLPLNDVDDYLRTRRKIRIRNEWIQLKNRLSYYLKRLFTRWL